MRHMLMTTALLVPLSADLAFAQQANAPADEGESTEGTVQVIEPETTEPEALLEEAGEAVEDAAEATGEVAGEAVRETGEAIEGVAQETEEAVEGQVQTLEVETVEEGQAAAPAEAIVREQAANELLVDWITDTTVRSPEGEAIGEIDDLILDNETGQLTAAILGVGGFLGIGKKSIAVNWSELQIDYDANEITMNLTRDEAEAAPEYVFRDQELPPPPAPVAGGVQPGAGGLGTVPATPPPTGN